MVSSITEYISYFEAGEDMTDEEYGIYMRAIHNFAYKDIEPDYTKLPPLVKAALRTVIASVRKNKEDRINAEKAIEARWGKKRQNTPVSEKTDTGVSEKTDTGVSEKTDTNVKENENDNEKVKEDGERPENLPPSPPLLSGPQENYSRIVFEKFKNAGLPCQKGDFFRFQACDFRLALQKLKGIPSQDVLSAVDNYIFELKNPESYQLREYSFDSFVNSKTFSNCLPANYRTQNFKKFAKDVPKGSENQEQDGARHFYDRCLKCGQKLMEWKNPLQKYKCDACGATFTWEEVDNATEHFVVP
jgi:hypothetical protein